MVAAVHLSKHSQKGKNQVVHVKPRLKQQYINLHTTQENESLLVPHLISCYPSHAPSHQMPVALFQVLYIQTEEEDNIQHQLLIINSSTWHQTTNPESLLFNSVPNHKMKAFPFSFNH